MLFVATCTDKPNSLPLRMDTRSAHLAYLNGLGASVKAGGALLTDDETSILGSMLIFEAASAADVLTLLSKDPYAVAGLFETVDVKPWRQAVGAPLA